MAEIYLSNNNPDLAIKYFKEALVMARQYRNKVSEIGIISDLGRSFMEKKEYREADKYLHQSLRMARKMGLKRIVRHVYMALADLKTREGKSGEAIGYMKNYYDVRDSLIKPRQIAELESRYEAEKKEQEIKILGQEKRIQSLWKNVFIAGSLLLAITFAVIHRLQTLRSQKGKELLLTQQKLNDKLKETDEMKSKFFANISHEFRTPLSLILAPIEEKIRSPHLPVKDIEDLRLVNRNAHRLLDLVNQLLDMSKLEAGKMTLRIQQNNPEEFTKVLVASFDSLAESRKINFSKNIRISLDEIWYDADKLEKIISNLLSNAFKFTPPGGFVDLSIQASPLQPQIEIKITDSGVGIPEEDLPFIFTPFYQSKNHADDSLPGTGLGLALVNELVKLYQGKIALVSKVNAGTSLTITLPISRESLPTIIDVIASQEVKLKTFSAKDVLYENEEVEIEENGAGVHNDSLLIVEDNPDLRNFIGSCFKNEFTILNAANGEEGYALGTDKMPTLIISDVMMPKMNGIDLATKLKTDERSSHIPIILLTAKTDVKSRIEGLQTGADDYLAKPFSAEELSVRVRNLINQRKKLVEKYKAGMMTISEPPSKEASIDDKFILRAKNLVEKHMSDPAFGVEKFAEEMHLSRAQLFRKIKALRGISPTEFINTIRLQKAATLILAKADTLTQISYSVGFNEQSYFAKRFRKKFGVSPSEYTNTTNFNK
jgi:signal transduction histidine kinase/DNA-binding response OmpR family regulator